MREREFKILGEELLDVRAFDIVRVLELDDFEKFFVTSVSVCGLCMFF